MTQKRFFRKGTILPRPQKRAHLYHSDALLCGFPMRWFTARRKPPRADYRSESLAENNSRKEKGLINFLKGSIKLHPSRFVNESNIFILFTTWSALSADQHYRLKMRVGDLLSVGHVIAQTRDAAIHHNGAFSMLQNKREGRKRGWSMLPGGG